MKRSMIAAFRGGTALALISVVGVVSVAQAADAQALRDKWCSKAHIRFFVGGAEGDAFGTIVYNGARQAAADTGAQVEATNLPRKTRPSTLTGRKKDRREEIQREWSRARPPAASTQWTWG